mmetsp:Transcript_3862/g.15002  ORF Transcript_3862/g.15002 Transcript_3862/m.15002 type:complete len:173 (-) Transcript_3862:449-967(-)|eukprot:scaffold192_cov190-Pinguiococcus_pyrenoidosus.AAC.3
MCTCSNALTLPGTQTFPVWTQQVIASIVLALIISLVVSISSASGGENSGSSGWQEKLRKDALRKDWDFGVWGELSYSPRMRKEKIKGILQYFESSQSGDDQAVAPPNQERAMRNYRSCARKGELVERVLMLVAATGSKAFIDEWKARGEPEYRNRGDMPRRGHERPLNRNES